MQRTPSGGDAGVTAVGAAGDAARATAAGEGGGGPLSVGSVVEVLRAEFPDVTASKIRFLEAEGLLEDRRQAPGARRFTSGDIDRLSRALRMQRDHCLPLTSVRERLDAVPVDGAGRLPTDGGPPPGGEGRRGPGSAGPAVRMGRPELLAAAEVSGEELAEWESYGLIACDDEGGYGLGEVAVARLAAELGQFGLQPRHLRAVKAAADREADLVDRVVAPLRRHQNPRTRAEAETTARDLAELSGELHAAFVRNAVRTSRGPASP